MRKPNNSQIQKTDRKRNLTISSTKLIEPWTRANRKGSRSKRRKKHQLSKPPRRTPIPPQQRRHRTRPRKSNRHQNHQKLRRAKEVVWNLSFFHLKSRAPKMKMWLARRAEMWLFVPHRSRKWERSSRRWGSGLTWKPRLSKMMARTRGNAWVCSTLLRLWLQLRSKENLTAMWRKLSLVRFNGVIFTKEAKASSSSIQLPRSNTCRSWSLMASTSSPRRVAMIWKWLPKSELKFKHLKIWLKWLKTKLKEIEYKIYESRK